METAIELQYCILATCSFIIILLVCRALIERAAEDRLQARDKLDWTWDETEEGE